ncbi:hypothetical protein [Psychromonas aquimarina]|uniref:hypothetical protein n=1 Tax=Psychromonas aquimarina TaxID=444919 RepID=UPI000419ECED|nr:hypothetical protein [Psychromonas aquimarina]
MPYSLSVVVQSGSELAAQALKSILERDTRPDFIEDLPLNQQAIFEILEEIDFPLCCIQKNELLYVCWQETELSLDEIIEHLELANFNVLSIFYIPDYPMSGDGEHEMDGYFLLNMQGKYKKIDRKALSKKLKMKSLTTGNRLSMEKVLFKMAGLVA